MSGLCKKTFGYPGTFVQLLIRITNVWFPGVELTRSRMDVQHTLTELEESLATLYFLKNASRSHDQLPLQRNWGLTKYR